LVDPLKALKLAPAVVSDKSAALAPAPPAPATANRERSMPVLRQAEAAPMR
jgi:hypothetical protein